MYTEARQGKSLYLSRKDVREKQQFANERLGRWISNCYGGPIAGW